MPYSNSILGVVAGTAFTFLTSGLASAALEPFSGEITLQLANQPAVTIATLSGDLFLHADGTVNLPAMTFPTAVAGTLTLPSSSFIPSVDADALGMPAGALGDVPGGFGGTLALTGTLHFRLAQTLALADLSVPLGVGTYSFPSASTANPGLSRFVSVSASFAPWTTAAVRLTGTVDGALTSLASVSGSRATTPQGGSILNLVSPVHIVRVGANGGAAQMRTIPGVARMNLLYAPEPSAPILLLLGFAGYGLYVRRANPSARSRI
jgi:hypothetical protein